LRIGDSRFKGLEDMLVGADFFLSHRVYVSNSQHKLYFTYNGGAVFNLSTDEGTAVAQNPNTAAESSQAQETDAGSSDEDEPDSAGSLAGNVGAATRDTPIPEGEPATAEDFYRRGAAYLSRHDYTNALSDEQRACQLNPQESKYFFERALVYWRTGQLQLSDLDVDTTLKLKPDDLNARLWRARRELYKKDESGAVADLDAADRAAAAQEGVRLEMAGLYRDSGQLPQAIRQYSMWIDTHRQDNALGWAYRSRCWTRALAGQELEEALADCNKILYHSTGSPDALADRGLVYLRLGKFDSAISDYSGALKQHPKDAWALYGRGLAETRLKQTEAAQADISAATALSPHIAEEFTKRGIAP
jgi:tetratricopeptide (TPR) repeat protein